MRYVWGLIVVAVVTASCGAASDTAVTVLESNRSDTESAPVSTETPATLDELPAPTEPMSEGFDSQPYAYSIDITLGIDDSPRTLSLSGAVDPAGTRGMIIGKTVDQLLDNALWDGNIDPATVDPDLLLTQVMIGEDSFARGLIPELGFPESTDPLRWYEAEPYTNDVNEMDVLDQTRTADDIVALLEVADVETSLVESGSGGPTVTATFTESQADLLRETDSVFELAPYSAAVEVAVNTEEHGHITDVVFSGDTEAGIGEVRVEITDVGVPILLPEIIDPTDPWDTPLPDLGDVITVPDGPVIVQSPTGPDVSTESGPLRISTTGSYSVPGFVDRTYVIEDDGDVLRIVDGDIFTGPSGYTTWNIGVDGRVAVERAILEAGLQGTNAGALPENTADGVRGTIQSDGVILFSIDGLDLGADELPAGGHAIRAAFLGLLDQLDDPNGVPGAERTAPEPWVPSHLAILVGDDDNPQYYSTGDIDWPFAATIDEMVSIDSDGERYVCLEGGDAAIAWNALLIDGVNNARVPVTDGVTTRELGLRISFPGYHVYGNPCLPVVDISGGSDVGGPPVRPEPALPVEIVDELLIPAADLGPDWSGGGIASVGRPPQISTCPSAAERSSEVAVDTFDRWMERTLTVTGPKGAELLQLVGEARSGADVDAIVDAIGPYEDCEQPLLDVGITDFSSGDLTDLPAGISAGSYWSYTDAQGRHELTADIALDSRYVMVLGYSSPDPIELADIDVFLAAAAARLDDLRAGVTACEQASTVPPARCGGL